MESEEQNKIRNADREKQLQQEIQKLKEENRQLKKKLQERKRQTDVPGSIDKGRSFDQVFSASKFHKAFFNQIPFLMWSKDLDGHYLGVNFTFCESIGKSEEEISGKTDYDLFPKSFADKFTTDDQVIFNTGKQIFLEEMIPLQSGFKWHETIKIPLLDDKDEIYGVAGFAKDITSRKNYENALRESEEKFRELAENTTDSFILRSGRKVIYVNPAFEQVYGYSRKVAYENPEIYKTWIHPDDKERIIRILQSEDYKSTYIFNEQYRIIKGDGSTSWIWNRSFPVWNDRGEVYRIVSVATNITGIKTLEEELRKSQNEQQALLNNMPHLAWLKDKDGRYISVNESFCRYFGLKREDILGKTDFDFVCREHAKDYYEKDLIVLKSKKPRLFFEIEDGEYGKRYSETHKTPVLNDENEVVAIAGISRDITEQKLSEQALIKSEEKFKDLVTLLPEVVFETNARGQVTYVNLKGYELMEYTQADLEKGINVFQLIAPGDVERAMETFQKLRYGNDMQGKEYTVITKSGKRLPVMVFTNNLFSDGQWVGIRGVMVDIKKRKQAEHQEKEYQSKLLFLNNTALEFLSMSVEDNLFHFIGRKLCEFIGDSEIIISRFEEQDNTMNLEYSSISKRKAVLIQKEIKIPPDEYFFNLEDEDVEEMRVNSERLVMFENGVYQSAFGKIPRRVANKMETILGVKQVYGMALLRSGKLYGSVLILLKKQELKDQFFVETFVYQSSIALHRKQLELELMDAKRQAEESDKLKTAFLANMSHEIRTPMNGILGLAHLLHSEQLSENERKEYLDMINLNGKLLLSLVNDIIDISRIESNLVELTESEFSVNQLLDELFSFANSEKMLKKKSDVSIRKAKYFTDEESYLVADQSKLKQILTNLISNSLKFTKSGEIKFGYELLRKEKKLLFFVKDTGIGIPSDKVDLVFDRFMQGDQSLTRPFGGSGLGLAISKGFVERMCGEIWAESDEGAGSTFLFKIPYKPAKFKKEELEEGPKKPDDYNWKNHTILIVEDNFVSYKLLETSLRKTNVNIIQAEDGESAIQLVKENAEIDIVLMDIQLPLMNGYDATREIKKINPDIPIIAQTANAMDDDRQKCLDAGCSDYITKPIILENLLLLIDKFVNGKN